MDMRLRFLGAAQNVTGSRYLLQTNGTNLLVDCGLYQERELRGRNWEPFPIPPRELDAVLLTHAHLDHCGLLPKLCKEGFKGPIYCTKATAQIARIILEDAGHLQEEDAAFKRRRHKQEGRKGKHPEVPLYTADDAKACFGRFEPVRYGRPISPSKDIEATFCNAGHVLGASFIRVAVSRNGQSRHIVFSGDVGRPDMPILKDPAPIEQADYLLVESTYAGRRHGDQTHLTDELADVVNATSQAGGNVVVPSFALERSQDLLYHLNELLLADRIPHLITFLDSPMAINISEVFEAHPELYDEEMTELVRNNESPFEFPGLRLASTARESKAINHIKGTVIIIAGSGMCTGGRIKHHLEHNIDRPESTILFVGYQAKGTLGRRIVDGAEQVRIHGRQRPVKARIASISGFSAHADGSELLQWLGTLQGKPTRTFVVHGEPESARGFARTLSDEKSWDAHAPEYDEQVTLD